MKKPKPLEQPNYKELEELCEYHLKHLNDDDDSEHYIYEAAIEAIYGEDVWDYINSKIL